MRAFFEKKTVKICSAVLIFVALVLLVFEVGMLVIAESAEPYAPSYDKEDISYLLDGRELSDADYDLLYRQTGLARTGVDELLASDMSERILKIQDDYFSSGDVEAANFGFFITAFDRTSGSYSYPKLKNGDIICSFSTYFSFFEIGHLAIVVDEDLELLAEITGYTSSLRIVHASQVFTNASHVVLRPNLDESVRTAAAEYVKDNMVGMKYDFFVGVFNKKAPETLERTHCAHFIWYVYNKLGYDLDSTGGPIVTPRDVCMSEYLDVIAIRGVDPNTLEK